MSKTSLIPALLILGLLTPASARAQEGEPERWFRGSIGQATTPDSREVMVEVGADWQLAARVRGGVRVGTTYGRISVPCDAPGRPCQEGDLRPTAGLAALVDFGGEAMGLYLGGLAGFAFEGSSAFWEIHSAALFTTTTGLEVGPEFRLRYDDDRGNRYVFLVTVGLPWT